MFLGVILFACQTEKETALQRMQTYTDIDLSNVGEPLFAETNEQYLQPGSQIRFVTESGEVAIPFGKYRSLYMGTLFSYANVMLEDENGNRWVAIDRNENVLFDIYIFDNGPDYTSEGLFRVRRNGKIGFANENGEVVIPCVYECALPFNDGRAKVALSCTQSVHDGEGCQHEAPISDEWYFIDRTGKK